MLLNREEEGGKESERRSVKENTELVFGNIIANIPQLTNREQLSKQQMREGKPNEKIYMFG